MNRQWTVKKGFTKGFDGRALITRAVHCVASLHTLTFAHDLDLRANRVHPPVLVNMYAKFDEDSDNS